MEKIRSILSLNLNLREAVMDEEMLLPTEVAIRIPNHRFFIFEIYRLIQKGLKRPITCIDFFDFLSTNFQELSAFKMTRRPPKKWLTKLTQNKEGVKILNYFDVYYGDPMVCFSPIQKKEKWESREIEIVFDVTGLKEEVTKTEVLLNQWVLDEADIVASLEPPDDVEVTDELVALVNKRLQELNELSAEIEANDDSIEKNSISEEGEDDMDTTTAAANTSGNQGPAISLEKTDNNIGEAAIICEKNSPIIIASENRSRFLAGLQSKAILDLPDAFICKDRLGAIELNAFDETGIVPEKWTTILREEGKGEFLNGYLNTAQGEAPEKNTASKSSPAKRTRTKLDEDELVSKEAAALSILKIVKAGKFRNNAELAVFWGLNPAACSMIKSHSMRLRISDVELVAKKVGIERDEFFKKVGLEYLTRGSQEGKVETSFDPAEDAPNDLISDKGNEVGLGEVIVTCAELPNKEWMKINQVIQTALFKTGEFPNEGIRKEFFQVYLIRQLVGCCVDFIEGGSKVCIKGHGNTFEFELGHIPF